MNPIITYGLFALTGVLCLLTWRTVRGWFRNHGSVDTLRRRQLIEAQKGELMYRAAAEQYGAIADGYAVTVRRLSPPTLSDSLVTGLTAGGASGGAQTAPTFGTGSAPNMYTAAGSALDVVAAQENVSPRTPGESDDSLRKRIFQAVRP